MVVLPGHSQAALSGRRDDARPGASRRNAHASPSGHRSRRRCPSRPHYTWIPIRKHCRDQNLAVSGLLSTRAPPSDALAAYVPAAERRKARRVDIRRSTVAHRGGFFRRRHGRTRGAEMLPGLCRSPDRLKTCLGQQHPQAQHLLRRRMLRPASLSRPETSDRSARRLRGPRSL